MWFHFLTMARKLKIRVNNNPDYAIRHEDLNGEGYVVVPVVMMVEGVHHGSGGRVYHTPSEFGRVVEAWNGVPITTGHPEDVNGDFVSVNSTDHSSRVIGTVYNAAFDEQGGRLMAEAWISVESVKSDSLEAYRHIINGIPLDVSIGAYSDDEETEGDWNGETYEAIARNYAPDHLAILPGAQGACSWDDGCGIRIHESRPDNMIYTYTKNQDGTEVTFQLIANAGFTKLISLATQTLDAMDRGGRIHYLEEMFDNNLVYKVVVSNSSGAREIEMYRTTYTYNRENDSIELNGDPERVYRNVSYGTSPAANSRIEREGGNDMPNCNCSVNEKIEAIIKANIGFEESDKDTLKSLGDEKVGKIFESLSSEDPAPETQTQESEASEPEVSDALSGLTAEEIADKLPDSYKAVIRRGVAYHDQRKKQLIDHLKQKERVTSVYSEEALKAMEIEELEKLFALAGDRLDDAGGQGSAAYIGLGLGDLNANHDPQTNGVIPKPMGWSSLKDNTEESESASS